jgi:Asp-tRNA(Asn)/Glu-tRNA(Gln) amidotransferase C subunit
MTLRADEPGTVLGQQAALANAPAQDEGCFLTPRVIG